MVLTLNLLEVTYQIQNGLPVIFANGQLLLTVTTDDAAIYGVDLETRAETVTAQLKEALIRAQRERQPDFLKRQIRMAVMIGIILFITSYLTFLVQQCLQKRRRRLAQEAQANATKVLTVDSSQPVSPVVIKTALKHSSKHQWQQLHGFTARTPASLAGGPLAGRTADSPGVVSADPLASGPVG
jgi:hypothetical protein